MDELGKSTPKCIRCENYYTTWDKYAPRGCKVFGIKSTTMPSILVYQESGKNCEAYKEKKLRES